MKDEISDLKERVQGHGDELRIELNNLHHKGKEVIQGEKKIETMDKQMSSLKSELFNLKIVKETYMDDNELLRENV